MIRGATFSSPDATISANTLQNTPHCDHSAFRPASSVGRWDLSGGNSNTTTAGPPSTPHIWVVGGRGGRKTNIKKGLACAPPAGGFAPPPKNPTTTADAGKNNRENLSLPTPPVPNPEPL